MSEYPRQEMTMGRENPEMKPLHRGIWAENLVDGQELPIGGSLFNKELTTKILLDFGSFAGQLEGFTQEKIAAAYDQSKTHLKEWLEKVGSDVDPYVFFVANQVQMKMQKLLEAPPDQPDKSFERQQEYIGGKTPTLSSLKGKTMCAERAAMGQYLLQQAGIESAYVGGVTMQNAKDDEEWPEDHSYLVIKGMPESQQNYIFDIARPRSQHNLPRLLKPAIVFDYDILKDKQEILVKTKEVLQGGELWFGVGEPVAGQHETIEG